MTDTVYETKDSGARVDFESGMRRDVDTGKARYDLIDKPMLKRVAELYARGAEKYGDNNWTLADSEAELNRFYASGFRHFMQWINGDVDEDHGAAVFFNIAAAEMVKAKIEKHERDEAKRRKAKFEALLYSPRPYFAGIPPYYSHPFYPDLRFTP